VAVSTGFYTRKNLINISLTVRRLINIYLSKHLKICKVFNGMRRFWMLGIIVKPGSLCNYLKCVSDWNSTRLLRISMNKLEGDSGAEYHYVIKLFIQSIVICSILNLKEKMQKLLLTLFKCFLIFVVLFSCLLSWRWQGGTQVTCTVGECHELKHNWKGVFLWSTH